MSERKTEPVPCVVGMQEIVSYRGKNDTYHVSQIQGNQPVIQNGIILQEELDDCQLNDQPIETDHLVQHESDQEILSAEGHWCEGKEVVSEVGPDNGKFDAKNN